MIIKDLGAVSAYAYAVEKGYTGTEEEFATLMASYASVAEEAAESAESASTSATSASASAQTATTKASEATTAAQTATAKAEETQADADAAALDASQALSAASTATSKASEAAQSASDAVTAKTAAQTAQTAAESSATTAQTAAQTATQKAAEAAESARTLTIDPTLTQSGQAADSKVVGDEIQEVKSGLNDIEDKFQDVSTEIDLNNYTAVQTLISSSNGIWSGMATNKSWFIPVDGVDEITVTADDSKNAYVALLKTNAHVANTYPDYATGSTRTVIEPGESLTLKVPDDANYIYVVKQSSAGSPIPKSIIFKTYSDVPLVDRTLTVDGGAADAQAVGNKFTEVSATANNAFPTDTLTGDIVTFADGANNIPLKSCVVQIEPVQSGSGDPSPDNIRPISGWTGAQVVRTGKNLFDKTATDTDNGYVAGKYIGDSGEVASSSSYNVSEYVVIKPSTTYTLSGISGSNPSLVFYDSEKQYISGIKYNYHEPLTFVTPNNAGYIRMSIPVASVDVFQLELGSTATEYTPFVDSDTYPIAFPSEAGTVYGGELDVTTGVLTVNRATVDMGTLNWAYDAPVFYTTALVNSIKQPLANTTPFLCSNYNAYPSTSRSIMKSTAPNGSFTITASGGVKNVVVKDSSYTDAASFKSAMDGVQLCYELATPTTYHLTPTEIKSLLGDNNIWADAGDTSVTYRADTKLYIEKKMAGTDIPMIADSNIVSGSYFMVGNNLYKATANIASGAAVVVGTNAVAITMAEALNEINS